MKTGLFSDITIVGVGLLGGSLGLAVKAANGAVRIVGVGHRKSSLDEALAIGAVDAVSLDPAQGVRDASLVVLCTPIGLFDPLLKRIAPALKRGAVVTDVGSTKLAVVRTGERALDGRAAFVGGHPIAGSEQRGVTFARADLYAGKTCILTPTRRTRPAALKRVDRFWRDLGMHVVHLSPGGHDRALGRVSHLPHALAALLVNLQKPSELGLAGTGFIDATRIAAGDPAIWRDIFLTNRKAVGQAMREFQRHIGQFCQAIEDGDGAALGRLLSRAQRRRIELLQERQRQERVDG